MKSNKIILNGILTSYITSPSFDSQKSLLFLHGWWQNAMSFEKIYSNLDKAWISYVWLDFPWFWMSDFPDENWWIKDYANFVKDFITKLWLNKPVLVWHSFWWRVWIIIWSSFENMAKIVLIWSAWIKPKVNKLRLILTKLWKIIFSLPWLKSIWNKIKTNISSRDYLNSWKLKQIFLNTINEDLTHLLPKIKYETLLIWWYNDKETPLKDWELMNKLIKDSKLKVFKEWSHFVFQEFSEEITNEILNFIK